MQTLGMTVTTSLSTGDALKRLKATNFDVVISNFNRPHESAAAYNLLETMRARNDTTPFIIYTVSVRPEHVEEAKNRGALGCTSRPQELLDLVIKALEARR
jgi:CheY-like chemotaxis protein